MIAGGQLGGPGHAGTDGQRTDCRRGGTVRLRRDTARTLRSGNVCHCSGRELGQHTNRRPGGPGRATRVATRAGGQVHQRISSAIHGNRLAKSNLGELGTTLSPCLCQLLTACSSVFFLCGHARLLVPATREEARRADWRPWGSGRTALQDPAVWQRLTRGPRGKFFRERAWRAHQQVARRPGPCKESCHEGWR